MCTKSASLFSMRLKTSKRVRRGNCRRRARATSYASIELVDGRRQEAQQFRDGRRGVAEGDVFDAQGQVARAEELLPGVCDRVVQQRLSLVSMAMNSQNNCKHPFGMPTYPSSELVTARFVAHLPYGRRSALSSNISSLHIEMVALVESCAQDLFV